MNIYYYYYCPKVRFACVASVFLNLLPWWHVILHRKLKNFMRSSLLYMGTFIQRQIRRTRATRCEILWIDCSIELKKLFEYSLFWRIQYFKKKMKRDMTYEFLTHTWYTPYEPFYCTNVSPSIREGLTERRVTNGRKLQSHCCHP